MRLGEPALCNTGHYHPLRFCLALKPRMLEIMGSHEQESIFPKSTNQTLPSRLYPVIIYIIDVCGSVFILIYVYFLSLSFVFAQH
uniref:Uncharacterized protein n=1 Tax=Podarcis muralis TaxID=64176 RepID=A0A670J5Q1_PODMU